MVTDVYFGNDYRLSIVLGPALATSTPAQMVYWGEGDFPAAKYFYCKNNQQRSTMQMLSQDISPWFLNLQVSTSISLIFMVLSNTLTDYTYVLL